MPILIFFMCHWYFSLFTQSFFLHRYAAHKAFTMSKGAEKFFFILCYFFQGASYLSPKGYASLHRMHHSYADTELDPHSPQYSKNLWDMMWKTKMIYSNIYYERIDLDTHFTSDIPEWKWLDKLADSWWSRIAWGIFYISFYIGFATHWWMFLLLPIHFLMGPFHGAIINWFAHKLGYVSFKMKDTSKNLLFLDFLMLGESYHNNHHRHPKDPNFGKRWHELDPIYPVIVFFNWIGLIKLKKQVAV